MAKWVNGCQRFIVAVIPYKNCFTKSKVKIETNNENDKKAISVYISSCRATLI